MATARARHGDGDDVWRVRGGAREVDRGSAKLHQYRRERRLDDQLAALWFINTGRDHGGLNKNGALREVHAGAELVGAGGGGFAQLIEGLAAALDEGAALI